MFRRKFERILQDGIIETARDERITGVETGNTCRFVERD